MNFLAFVTLQWMLHVMNPVEDACHVWFEFVTYRFQIQKYTLASIHN